MIWFHLLVFLQLSINIQKEPPIGPAFFAIQSEHFPCAKALKMIEGKTNLHIPILWGTFGTDNTCLSKLIEQHPDAEILIHMSNEVSRRKGNMGRGDLFRGWNVDTYNRRLEKYGRRLSKKVSKRVNEIKDFFESEGFQGRLILSLGLEDQFTDKAIRKLIKNIREIWPYDIARNPVNVFKNYTRYGRQRLDFVELHGLLIPIAEPTRTILSNDGTGIMFSTGSAIRSSVSPERLREKIREYRKRGVRVSVWWPEGQGLSGDSGSAVKPRNRRIRISREHILTIRRLIK